MHGGSQCGTDRQSCVECRERGLERLYWLQGSKELCLGCDRSSREVSFLNALQAGLPNTVQPLPNPSLPADHSSPSLWIALKGHKLFLSRACFFPLHQEEGPTWFRSFLGGQKHPAASPCQPRQRRCPCLHGVGAHWPLFPPCPPVSDPSSGIT